MTTSAAATAVGDTNVKVASVTNLAAGQPIMIDTGQNLEVGSDHRRRHVRRGAAPA